MMVFSEQPTAISHGGTRRIIFPMIHNMPIAGSNEIVQGVWNSPPNSKESQHHKPIDDSYKGTITKMSSIESDMPSVTSLSSSSVKSSLSAGSAEDEAFEGRRRMGTGTVFHRPFSWNEGMTKKAIRFDPCIWVHEFQRSRFEIEAAWFTTKDMNKFKSDAVRCIVEHNAKALRHNHAEFAVSESTYNSSGEKQRDYSRAGKVLFSHPALGVDSEYDSHPVNLRPDSNVYIPPAAALLRVNHFRKAVAENEIRNILVVDSHAAFSNLIVKGLRQILPHVLVATARNREEALMHIQKRGAKTKSDGNFFDVIIVDEKLSKRCHQQSADSSASSASLPLDIADLCSSPDGISKTLFVIVSSHIDVDTLKMKAEGADFVWSKPPPLMNDFLRDTMVKTILIKRGRTCVATKLF
jgi:CheY-like chemotaxis protein